MSCSFSLSGGRMAWFDLLRDDPLQIIPRAYISLPFLINVIKYAARERGTLSHLSLCGKGSPVTVLKDPLCTTSH